jgi:hypothetical protein
MAIATLPTTTPAGAVADASALLGGLSQVMWAAREADELVGTIEALQTLRAVTSAIEAQVLGEVDARDIPRRELAWGSTVDWFTHLAGLRRGEGRRRVEHARRLTDDRAATHSALLEAAVSPEQAAVVVEAVEALPGDRDLRDRAEQVLLDEAGMLNATELAHVGRRVIDVVDPGRDERRLELALAREERAAYHQRFLSISDDGAGGVRLKGRGTTEDAAVLRAALLPLTAPTPQADADGCGSERDPRDHGARCWDALVHVAQHSLTTDLAPECHGARPRLSVLTDLESLRSGVGVGGRTDDGLHLAASAVRRLACDADVIPVVLGSRSEVLDVGRLQRLVTAAQWRALVARDAQCTFPGCTRPPVMCHAHHVEHWVDGGRTALDNLALLCGHHHRLVHDSPWRVRISPDDHRPEFLPPPEPERTPDWIRHRPRRE